MAKFDDIEEKLSEAAGEGHSFRKEGLDSEWHEEELEEKKDEVREDVAYLKAAFDMYSEGFLPEKEVHRYAEEAMKSYEEFFKTVQKIHDFNSNNTNTENVELEHTNYLRDFYVSTTATVENQVEIAVADEEKLSSW